MVNTYLLQQLLNTLHENAVHSVVTIAVFCLSVKGGRRGSPLKPNSCIHKTLLPLEDPDDLF